VGTEAEETVVQLGYSGLLLVIYEDEKCPIGYHLFSPRLNQLN
jgi:hypothetical protein